MYKKKISLVTSCALALNLFLGVNVFALEKDTINIKDNSASIEEYAKLLGGTFEKEKVTENFGNKNYPKNKYIVKFNGGLEEENGATIEIYENRQEIYINEKYTPLATQEVNGFVVPSDQKLVIEKDKVNLPIEFFEKNLSTKLEGKKLKIVLEEEKEEDTELEEQLETEESSNTTNNLETNTAINNTGNTTNTTQNNQTSNNTNSNNSSNNNSSTNNSTSNNNSSSNTQKPNKPNNSNGSSNSGSSNKPSKPNNSTGNSNTGTTTPPTAPPVTPEVPETPVIPETPVTPNPPESSEPDTSTPDDSQNQYDSSQSEDTANLTDAN